MTAWWLAPEWGKAKAMEFPDRTTGKQYVVRVPAEREPGDKEQKPDERRRLYRGRCLPT